MTDHDDGARLRIYALEKRVASVERVERVLKSLALVVIGLVLAGVLVGAFELHHILSIVKGAH
jgi:hypothetical protein